MSYTYQFQDYELFKNQIHQSWGTSHDEVNLSKPIFYRKWDDFLTFSKQITHPSGFHFGVSTNQKNTMLRKSEQEDGHILIVGGSGTGKSRSVLIPTIMGWEGAVIALDIKGELKKHTCHSRSEKGQVFEWNPMKRYSCRINPISRCTFPDSAVALAKTFFHSSGSRNYDSYWNNSSSSFLASMILDTAMKNGTFEDIAKRFSRNPDDKIATEQINSVYAESRLLAGVIDVADNTRSCIFSMIHSALDNVLSDKQLMNAMSGDDVTLETFSKPNTLYLTIKEEFMQHYSPMLSAIITSFVYQFQSRSEDDIPLLIVLDEFASLSQMHIILSALSTLRSRKVHLAIALQSLTQLDMIYGSYERKVIVDNCKYQLVLSVKDLETQKYFSDKVGNNEKGIPLLPPHKFGELPNERLAVLFSNRKPLLVKLEETNLKKRWHFHYYEYMIDTPIRFEMEKNPLDYERNLMHSTYSKVQQNMNQSKAEEDEEFETPPLLDGELDISNAFDKGIEGEKQVAYQLQFADSSWHVYLSCEKELPNTSFKYFIKHGLNKSTAQQFDGIIVTDFAIFHLEIKNWSGEVVFQDAHCLVNNKTVDNPMMQLQRHQSVLEEIAEKEKITLPIIGLLCMVQGAKVIDTHLPFHVLQNATEIIPYIESQRCQYPNPISIQEIKRIWRKIDFHKHYINSI